MICDVPCYRLWRDVHQIYTDSPSGHRNGITERFAASNQYLIRNLAPAILAALQLKVQSKLKPDPLSLLIIFDRAGRGPKFSPDPLLNLNQLM